MFEFEWPYIFLILPLPFLLRYFLRPKSTVQSALKVPFFAQLNTTQRNSVKASKFGIIFLSLIWLLVVGATARPMWLGEPVAIPTKGRDLMVAVDLSGSMKAQDMQVNGRTVNRLDMIKYVLDDFIQRRVGDRVGLILFGDTAYLQAPLTFDRETVSKLLDESVIGLVGNGTAIGDAIGLAVKRFRQREESNRVLVLLTDGRNTSGNISPEQALTLAKENQLKIYTIGVGSEERSMFGFSIPSGGASFDENALRNIAEQTGGEFFKATDTQRLIEIYQRLDVLEPVEAGTDKMRPQTSLSHWMLIVASVLSGTLLILKLISSAFKKRGRGRSTRNEESVGSSAEQMTTGSSFTQGGKS